MELPGLSKSGGTTHSAGQVSKVIGIDFGTCNSCMAVMEQGGTLIIPNAEGARITPSVIAFTEGGGWLVGEPAKRQAVTNPKNTVFSVKRLIGQKYDWICDEAKWMPYTVVKAENGDAHVKIGDSVYSPPALAALILRKLKVDAEAYLGMEVSRAVITVPSYFNDSQRQATKDACMISGLEVLRIINESTAACLAYGCETKQHEIVAITHFGGGTFDVSIVETGDGLCRVLSTTGDTHLGGDDIDSKVVEWLSAEFKRKHGIDLTPDPMALQRLKEAAEKAKCELSTLVETDVNLPFITADASGPKHLRVPLTRATLEDLTKQLTERMRGPVMQALKDAQRSAPQIDKVVLAGAMTRMPKVQEVIKDLFGREPCRGVHPEEVVAVGASIQAGVMIGDVKDVLLVDVTPLSLGIETLGGVMTKLVDRNTTIPTSHKQIFTTAADSQTSVDVHVLQGERSMAAACRTLARFELSGIPAAPRGIAQIEVSFDIDANGILHVSARDLATGTQQSVDIKSSSGLTEREISEAAKKSELFSQHYKTQCRPVQPGGPETGHGHTTQS